MKNIHGDAWFLFMLAWVFFWLIPGAWFLTVVQEGGNFLWTIGVVVSVVIALVGAIYLLNRGIDGK